MKARNSIIIILFMTFCLSGFAASQYNTRIQELEQELNRRHKTGEFNGVILVMKDDQLFTTVLGINAPGGESLNLDSSFNLASVSKQFTAMGIMILAEHGKLNLDDPITKWLSELPYSNVTIRNLLNHTGGIVNYMELADKYWDKSTTFTTTDMLKLFVEKRPHLNFEPNSKFEYSNTGYVFLSEIIARASEQPFDSFLYNSIFKPLKMKNTRAFNLISSNQEFSNRVLGMDGGELNDLIYLDGVAGDGGVYSSVNDLLKWAKAIKQRKFVSNVMYKQAFLPAKLSDGKTSNYGFGWFLEDYPLIRHRGKWCGFRAEIAVHVDNDNVQIILDNSTNENFLAISKLVRSAFKERIE